MIDTKDYVYGCCNRDVDVTGTSILCEVGNLEENGCNTWIHDECLDGDERDKYLAEGVKKFHWFCEQHAIGMNFVANPVHLNDNEDDFADCDEENEENLPGLFFLFYNVFYNIDNIATRRRRRKRVFSHKKQFDRIKHGRLSKKMHWHHRMHQTKASYDGKIRKYQTLLCRARNIKRSDQINLTTPHHVNRHQNRQFPLII